MNNGNLWWLWEGAIPPEECDKFINTFYVEKDSIDATVGTEGLHPNPEYGYWRKTRICWDKDKNSTLYNTMYSFVLQANVEAGWRLALQGMEHIQLAKYENSGFYDFHMDTYYGNVNPWGNQRKLSAVLLLSDPSTYVGGDFVFFAGKEVVMPRTRGTVITFPGTMLHKVTPVTEGVRFSATAWADGPPLR